MTIFNFGSNNINFSVSIDENIDNWLIVKDEKYRPDRGIFVLERFKEDFPEINVDNIDKVYSLCSRSAALNEWLAKVNLSYALIQNEPTFYRDKIEASRYNLVSEELLKNNSILSNKAKEELELAADYRNKMDKVKLKYSKIEYKSKEARVISMNTTELPLTLQLAIENYTPASDDSPNRRSYARELLINYKLSLLNVIKENPEVNIDMIIKDSYVK
jgi:hypothetical protein